MIANRRVLLGALVAAVCVAAIFAIWKIAGISGLSSPAAREWSSEERAGPKTPSRGFGQVLVVFERGGTPREVEQAIGFLDTGVRLRKGLTPENRTALLAAMERGAPAEMADGPWAHLFNSACNALAVNPPDGDESLLGLLERVAVEDPRNIMRLYALQHLGRHYSSAGPDTRRRLRGMVRRMLDDPASPTAGTALVLWRQWEKTEGTGAISSFELSRAMAADPARPVDVRVAALHAIGDDPGVLDLTRAIAGDRTQPVILRKAALSLIGRHGQERDLEVLRECSAESSRLSQAGEPAARALKDRLAGVPRPVLHPY